MSNTTIFCLNCGTANRDDAEVCAECGSVIPKLAETKQKGSNQPPTPPPPPPTANFGIETERGNIQIKSPYPSIPKEIEDFGISVQSSPYPTPTSSSKLVCESCGMILRTDDKHCPNCGKPIIISTRSPTIHPQPMTTSSSKSSASVDSPPPSLGGSYPILQKPKSTPQSSAAKCIKCGAIVYDYETRCNNCGRILAPPRQETKSQPIPSPSSTPTGTARCSKCNAVVYPHQTICPNCNKPLTPVKAVTPEPYQRVSRCRRCGHLVYPTDSVCANCGRNLDPV